MNFRILTRKKAKSKTLKTWGSYIYVQTQDQEQNGGAKCLHKCPFNVHNCEDHSVDDTRICFIEVCMHVCARLINTDYKRTQNNLSVKTSYFRRDYESFKKLASIHTTHWALHEYFVYGNLAEQYLRNQGMSTSPQTTPSSLSSVISTYRL